MPQEERKGERRVRRTAVEPMAMPRIASRGVRATVTPRRVTMPSPPRKRVKMDFQWPATAAAPAKIRA